MNPAIMMNWEFNFSILYLLPSVLSLMNVLKKIFNYNFIQLVWFMCSYYLCYAWYGKFFWEELEIDHSLAWCIPGLVVIGESLRRVYTVKTCATRRRNSSKTANSATRKVLPKSVSDDSFEDVSPVGYQNTIVLKF